MLTAGISPSQAFHLVDGEGRHQELEAPQRGPAAAGHKLEQGCQLLGVKAFHHLQHTV